MASRRTRIKGVAIANIPQRKRTVQTEGVLVSDKTHSEEITDKESIIAVDQGVSDDHSNRSGSLDSIQNEENPMPVMKETTEGIRGEKEPENVENSMKPTNESQYDDIPQNTETASVETDSKQNDLPIKTTRLPSAKFRRKFLKPGINLNAAKQRNISKNSEATSSDENKISDVLKTNNEASSKEGNDSRSSDNAVLNEVSISTPSTEDSNVIAKPLPDLPHNYSTPHSEVILNEACLSTNKVPPVNEHSLTSSPVKKLVPLVSDIEYPAAPPSPSKINRSRIKAIPKLSMRRTSCSASESEDEARKYGRIRNNSVCSVASTTGQELPTPTSPLKETPVPKKIIRTEQSRKLAEARKEFYKRFGTNMPDKQKLKMIDLIFYNPVTSPMSQKPPNKNNSDTNSKEKEQENEEQVDEPEIESNAEEKEKENDDEDSNMLVPQIKIGPSGEIILDEQSLVVENSELAKQKEEIMNSRVIDGDFDTTGYGIYKRVPRTHAWSHKETLRFYKALNLIGTDFTMMTQLFPDRNRRELKMKFKREEKTNKHLIDKAIMQPCSYNFLDLKREMQIEFEEEALLKKLKEEELEAAKQNKALRERKRKIKKTNATENSDGPNNSEQDSHNDSDLPLKKRLVNLEITKKSKPRTKKLLNIRSVLEDDDDADVSDMTQSDSDEEEFIPFLKPTRSGRMPKSTIKFSDSDDFVRPPKKRILKKIDDAKSADGKTKQGSTRKGKKSIRQQSPLRLSVASSRTRRFSSTSSVESNSDRLVPGSVVVTTEESLDGRTDYKVFMVTPEKKLTPLDLESDVIAKLVRDKQSTEFPLVTIPEKNVTIPASEEDGTEKSNESAKNNVSEGTETIDKDKAKHKDDMEEGIENDIGDGAKKVVVAGPENGTDKGGEKDPL